MKPSVTILAAAALALAVALPTEAWAGKNVTTINKSIRIDDGSESGDVRSVNGSIRIGADSVVESVQSVNGSISIRDGVRIEDDVEAVNGAIDLGRGATVGGNVESVNGRIRMEDTAIAGDIETVNGGIQLLDGTVVEGNVTVKKPWGWGSGRDKPVRVEIGEKVRVHGDLIFEHPVELMLHGSAEVGEIIGEEVTRLEG